VQGWDSTQLTAVQDTDKTFFAELEFTTMRTGDSLLPTRYAVGGGDP